MRLKGKRALFHQILAGTFRIQICHNLRKMQVLDPKPLENAGFGP